MARWVAPTLSVEFIPAEDLQLYTVVENGVLLNVTFLTDRREGQSAQLEVLDQLTEVPPNIVVCAQEDILNSRAAGYRGCPFPEGRLQPPVASRLRIGTEVVDVPALEIIVPSDEAVRPRPWSYVWPVMESADQPAFEAGEQAMQSWRADKPFAQVRSESGVAGLGTILLNTGNDHPNFDLTNHRVIIHSPVDVQLQAREDYSLALGLVSETLMNTVAAAKQMKRFSHRNEWLCAAHVRFEWISSVGFAASQTVEKKLFGGTKTTLHRRVFVTMPLPGGGEFDIWLEKVANESEFERIDALRETILSAVRSYHRLAPDAVIPDKQIVDSPNSHVEITRWRMPDAVPWSFPQSLLGKNATSS